MFGEAAFLVLGEDDLVIEGYFEGAAAGGDEFQALDVLFMLVQQLFRQTDGFREVASRSAVFDAETVLLGHECAPFAAFLLCRSIPFSMTLRTYWGQCNALVCIGRRELRPKPDSRVRGNDGKVCSAAQLRLAPNLRRHSQLPRPRIH